LQYSDSSSIKLLLELIALLRQRPEFSSGQILGHWQGAYGPEATDALQTLMSRVTFFSRAREHSTEDRQHAFDLSQEYTEALHQLKKHLRQRGCDTIIRQLNKKPLKEWSSADKRLYREATGK